MNITGIGKVLMIVGAGLVLIGLVLVVKDKFPWVGRLPGDIYVTRNTFSCYFPLTTCIIISIVVTLLLTLFRK